MTHKDRYVSGPGQDRPLHPHDNRRIVDLVKRNLTLKEACQLVGIGYRSAQRYLSKDPEYLKARMEARLAAR